MSILVDLHSHTTASDGLFEPEALVAEAAGRGLDVLAVTDHDTIDGVERCAVAAAAHPSLRLLPGVEVSCFVDATEIHVLGLGIRAGAAGFREWLAQLIEERIARVHRIAAALETHGIRLDVTELVRAGRSGSVGRPHIARLLVSGGHVRDVDEAFRRWLSPGRPAYTERLRVDAREAISRIHDAGGVAIQAHPGQMGKDEDIPRLIAWGLDGLEVHHPDHTHAMRERYARVCDRLGLIASGGSDFHGIDGNGRHGAPLGSRTTPESAWARIERRIA